MLYTAGGLGSPVVDRQILYPVAMDRGRYCWDRSLCLQRALSDGDPLLPLLHDGYLRLCRLEQNFTAIL